MKRAYKVFALLFAWLLISVPLVALAVDVSQAVYRADITVTNNGTATSNQSTVFTLNSTSLLDQNFVNSAFNNTSIINNLGEDTPFMPGGVGQPWVVWVSSIGGAITTNQYSLYLGGNQSMQSKLRYFPAAEGMNVTDNASLELGSNFTITQTAFIDTSAGANKTLVYKPGAITTNISGAGNITVTIPPSVNATTSALAPSGAGNSTTIEDLVGAAAHWQANLTNDGDTTYVGVTENSGVDLYSVANTSQVGLIAYVKLTIVAKVYTWAGSGTRSSSTYLRTHSTDYSSVSGIVAGSYTSYSVNYTTNPFTGLAWTWQEVNDMEIGVALDASVAGTDVRCTQVYAEVNYSNPATVTATGVSTGNHTITILADSSNLSISVDGTLKDTVALNGANVTNNANAYQFFTANATPYVQRHQIWVGGVLRQDINWQYNSAFTDASGNGHTAIPTFRTATSNANVTANMTVFVALDETTSPYTNPAIGSYNLTQSFTQPGGMYTELNISVPGATLINNLLDGASIPRALFWFPVLFGLVNLIGLAVYAVTKNIFVQVICMGFMVMFFSLAGGYGYWVFIEYIILALAIILAERQSGF